MKEIKTLTTWLLAIAALISAADQAVKAGRRAGWIQ